VQINMLYLNYSKQDRIAYNKSKPKYQDEVDLISKHKIRNNKAAKLLHKLSKSGNVLGLFSKIEHGKLLLQETIKEKTGITNFYLLDKITPKSIEVYIQEWKEKRSTVFINSKLNEKQKKTIYNKLKKLDLLHLYDEFISKIVSLTKYNIYFIYGDTKGSDREYIRHLLEEIHADELGQGAIVIGSWQVVSTGVNYKNLRHVVYLSSLKSYTKVIQSIGRGMRLHKKKSVVDIWDLVDDLSYETPRTKKDNYIMKHSHERIEMYRDAEYPLKEKEIYL